MAGVEDMGSARNGRTVAEEVRFIVDSLKDKYGEGEAKAIARFIFENMKGWSAVDLAIKANEHITEFIEGKIDGIIERLMHDEPVQYIFGIADSHQEYFFYLETYQILENNMGRFRAIE